MQTEKQLRCFKQQINKKGCLLPIFERRRPQKRLLKGQKKRLEAAIKHSNWDH